MTDARAVPPRAYGVLRRETALSAAEEAAEQVRRLGYAILDGGYAPQELAAIRAEFERTRAAYIQRHGEAKLRALDEYHTIRAPLTHGGPQFLQLAFNPHLMAVLGKLIEGQFILNQQNGVINPPGESYNQGSWHRDLPYQHFVSSRALAINALFCVDDFTVENGSTFVLPASHQAEPFPSEAFVASHAVQVEARAGQYILLDCMTFHSGGFNRSGAERRAVNHVFTIPYFKQQIRLPGNLAAEGLDAHQQQVLGFRNVEPDSIAAYLATREGKKA
jgi:ectoine hydroxylase-related dioxygenase (phytanoyl-CoA dioxygenase family)